jgi:FKBP-type peptidyl-prolyl cis-trans isomerase FkpA
MNVAVEQRRAMRAPGSGRGWVCAMLAGTLLAGAAHTQAQEPGASKPAAPAPGAKKAAAGAKPAAAAPAAGDAKSKASYSIGVSMGEQMKSTGLSPDAIAVERVAQGIRDALAGKAKMTQADQDNIREVIMAARSGQVEKNHSAAAAFLAENGKKKDIQTTASGLQYKVVAPGSGAAPTATDEVVVNYKGTLLDGTVFDQTEGRGPATFGVGQVIPGWTEALMLMKPGAKYQLFIPPKLAYDERSPPSIPPGSMLLFDVELVSVKPKTPAAGAAPHPAPSTPAPAPAK